MASARIDVELNDKIKSIKTLNRIQIKLPDIINLSNSSLAKTETEIEKETKEKITYELDLFSTEGANFVGKKILKIPAGVNNLIIKNLLTDCYIDFSEAQDLEYLEYGYYELGDRMASVDVDEPEIKQWPPNLKYLILHYYSYSLSSLPNSLLYLRLPATINDALVNLPASLLALVFGTSRSCHNFKYQLHNLPYNLRYLALPGRVQCDLEHLPSMLEVLDLGADEYTQTLNALPDTIRYLTLGNSAVPITKLPNALEELNIHYDKIDKCGIYSRETYDILADMNFPKGFRKLIINDELNLLTNDKEYDMVYEIKELIKKKMLYRESSTNKYCILLNFSIRISR